MSNRREAGEKVRREVMSDKFVDRALNSCTEFDAPIQDQMMETAWGTTWVRDDLPKTTRSLITIAMLTALKCPDELKGHVRGALRNGCTVDEIRAVLLHAMPYAGAPATLQATKAAKEVISEYSDADK